MSEMSLLVPSRTSAVAAVVAVLLVHLQPGRTMTEAGGAKAPGDPDSPASSSSAAAFPAPSDLRVMTATRHSIKLRWRYTSSPGGRLAGFRIFYFHHQSYEDVKTVGTADTAKSAKGSDKESKAEMQHFYELTGLEPYTIYEIWVRAIVNGEETDESDHITANTDVGRPSAPRVTNATCYANNSVYVEWRRPESFHKAVDYYMLYYKREGEQTFEATHLEAGQKEVRRFLIRNLSPRQRYVLKVCAGTKSLNPPNLPVWGDPSEEKVVFLSDSECGSFLAAAGELNKGVRHRQEGEPGELSVGMVAGAVCAVIFLLLACVGFVIWRSYCKSAYYSIDDIPRAVAPAGIPDWEDAPGPTSVVITGSTGVASSGIASSGSGGGGGGAGSSGSMPVEQLDEHVSRLHADSDIGFAREYEEIQKICIKEGLSAHEHCSHPDNKHKNRYLNIVAYDHSRVVLSPLPGQKKASDYINANYIDGFQQFHAYIGTQGPLEDTCEAFWRMVWEQNVYVIVMITNLVERGRRKCDMYWPKDDNPVCYGLFEVHLEREQILANFTIRTLKVKHLKLKKKRGPCGGEREVLQYHYTSWPDHGVPAHPLPVLSFIRKSSNLGLGVPATEVAGGRTAGGDACDGGGGGGLVGRRGGPVIVHCSAGVGRTGTYIAIDAVLRQIKATGRFNVFGLLRHMRRQRNHLVQTEEQYVFIHDALLEAVRSGDTEIGSRNIAREIERLGTKGEDDEFETPLDEQFKLLTAFAPSEFHYMSARKACNASKCRDPNLLPVETSRVALSPRPGIEGSDFINATWLHGHRKLREFVVTQHPTAETKGEFWRMLWDHNAQTIVLLSSVEEDGFPVFWPVEDDEFDQDTFRVRFTERAVHEGHSTLDFVLSSSQDDYELTARIIHCPEWPAAMAMATKGGKGASSSSNGVVASAVASPVSTVSGAGSEVGGGGAARILAAKVFDVLKLVQDWHLEYQRGPLVVVDKCGGTEAATFCALTTLCNQLETDNAIDVYQVAKLYHDKRPGIWKSKDDILFLYKALEALVASDHAVNPVALSSAATAVAVSSHCLTTIEGDGGGAGGGGGVCVGGAGGVCGGSLPPTSPTSQAGTSLQQQLRPQSAAATTSTSASAEACKAPSTATTEEEEPVAVVVNGALPPPLVPERRHSSSFEEGRSNGSLSNVAETSLPLTATSFSSGGKSDDHPSTIRRPHSMPPPDSSSPREGAATHERHPSPQNNGCVVVMPPEEEGEEKEERRNINEEEDEEDEERLSETAALTTV